LFVSIAQQVAQSVPQYLGEGDNIGLDERGGKVALSGRL